MHDFDSRRQDPPDDADRRIQIGGHELVFKAKVGANVMGRFIDSPEAISPTCPHCRKVFQVGSPRPQQDTLAATDAMILAWLEPGQEDVWAEIRSDDAPNPLSLREVQQFGYYVLEVLTHRPTESPSGSTRTSATDGTSSTDGSPSPGQA